MDKAHATARCWLEINENAMLGNLREAQSLMAPDVRPICVLKADAYGYGGAETAAILYEAGVRYFAVACLPEALEIRAKLPEAWILILGVTAGCETQDAVRRRIRMTVSSVQEAQRISRCAVSLAEKAYVHIKMDTGLHRLGFESVKEALPALGLPGIEYEGLYSHLALRGKKQTPEQCACFRNCVRGLGEAGYTFPMIHLLDSIGLVRMPKEQYTHVRIGAFLYGNIPPDYIHFERRLAPAALKARVTRVAWVRQGDGVGYGEDPMPRDTLVATIAAGYVDGYPRLLSGRGEVLLHGRRARVLGRVCMDQMMVDVTEIPETAPGDTAVLLGDGISLNEFAAWADMNRNEVTCMIGRRVPRLYIRDGQTRKILSRMEGQDG